MKRALAESPGLSTSVIGELMTNSSTGCTLRTPGTKLRDKELTGELSFSGQLVAVHIPGPGQTTATDTAAVSDELVATVTHQEQVKSVRVADSGGHSLAADVRDAETVKLELSGPPARGEHHALEACRILVERLRTDGEDWSDPKFVGDAGSPSETGIDCIAYSSDSRRLEMQVVRADGNAQLWKTLADVGRVSGIWDAPEVADALRSAIERKAAKTSVSQRRSTVLVLDAGLVASAALGNVIDEFRRAYGVWVSDLGFAAVWCAGPVSALTWRLDTPK